jgi:transposase
VGARRLIQITPQIRILVAVESIDARKGIDSLAQLCREKLAADPFSGCLFIFRSRRGTAIKLLGIYVEFSVMCSRPAHWHSGNGFCKGSTAH